MREMERFLEQWEMDVRDVRRRLLLAPTPRERERWHAIWLLAQGWTALATGEALERDSHTISRWAAAFGEGGLKLVRRHWCPILVAMHRCRRFPRLPRECGCQNAVAAAPICPPWARRNRRS